MRFAIPLALVGVLGFAAAAAALDQPITGARLVLRRTPTTQTLAFLSRDPAFSFPPIASPDDPASGTPGGLRIELLTADETVAIAVPPGVGWTSATRLFAAHRFHNSAAPGGPTSVRRVSLKQGRHLQVSGAGAGLALHTAPAAVAIRITVGTRRSCARFDGAAVRRSEPGYFVGKRAPAPPLADCSDASLLGLTCDAADYPTCGGSCADGSACRPMFRTIAAGGGIGCACATMSCPNGFAYGGDPSEFVPFGCYPIPCSGTHPTCGTTCGDGGICSAFTFDFASVDGCLCAIPAACEGSALDGYVCPAGQVCHVALNGTRSCGAP